MTLPLDPVAKRGHVREFGHHGEDVGLDAPGVEEDRDEPPYVVGLPVDDADEPEHLAACVGWGERGGRWPLST